MINFNFDTECCGCFACLDICPKQCISQVKNKYGFLIPNIDRSRCINCNLCEKVCPVLNPEKLSYENRKVYSAYNLNENIRAAGSSGSIFYTLAKSIIKSNGIVYGAAFVDHFQLKHISAESIEELTPLLKSKYLQSNTKGVYKSIKKELKTSRKVLFVGTPCQCNALYKSLRGKKPENLLLIDFICHGVPSQDLFDKALSTYEKKHNCKIEEFTFRHKLKNCIHSFMLKTKDINSRIHYIEDEYTKFPFYYGFKRFICLRESCYHCKFCVEERVSDITLADFWELEKIDNSISLSEFNKGISMLICNSSKGENAITSILPDIKCKEQKVSNIERINYAYTKPAKKGIYARQFWKDYNKMDYEQLEYKHFTHIPFQQLSFFQKIKVYLIAKFKL